MKTIEATLAPPADPPKIEVSLAGVAELYAAALAFEPADPNALAGLGDMNRVSLVTTAGAARRLVDALALIREGR